MVTSLLFIFLVVALAITSSIAQFDGSFLTDVFKMSNNESWSEMPDNILSFRKLQTSKGITTYAGGGGFLPNGVAATTATLLRPTDICISPLGDVYFSDIGSHRVLLVTKSTGIITNVAGTGIAGYSVDGVAATSALYWPWGVVLDTSGNLYISENSGRIRLVTTSTGIITTYTNTPSQYPRGMAFDTSGNLYIAQGSSPGVLIVNKNTGVMTYFAGNGHGGGNGIDNGDGGPATSAQLWPFGLVFDASGNLYISDNNYCAICVVDKNTGIISRVAGMGVYRGDKSSGDSTSCGYSGDGGPATSARLSSYMGVLSFDASGNLYIADADNNVIRVVMMSTRIITTFAGTGVSGYSGDGASAINAQLSSPFGVKIDTSGMLYIADTNNHVIRVCGISVQSSQPTTRPSRKPTRQPSSQPSRQPSMQPSRQPSRQPSSGPSSQPSTQPSRQPINRPTQQPTRLPTQQPTRRPSRKPSSQPSTKPTFKPTPRPTKVGETNPPTVAPSLAPTLSPTVQPTQAPTTTAPTTPSPSYSPSLEPTFSPVADSTPVNTVQVVQTITGVTSDSTDFRTSFLASLQSLLPTDSVVTITTVIVVNVRRRLQTAGVSVKYEVTTRQPVSTLISLLSTSSTALTTKLQKTFPAASISAPSVTVAASAAPSSSPINNANSNTNANASSASNGNTPVIAGVVGGVGGLCCCCFLFLLRRKWKKAESEVGRVIPL